MEGEREEGGGRGGGSEEKTKGVRECKGKMKGIVRG